MRVRRVGIVAAAAAMGLGIPAVASGATVTVGSPLDGSFAPNGIGEPIALANQTLGEAGANVASAVTGVIIRCGSRRRPFRLRVLAPGGGGTSTGAGTSNPETPTVRRYRRSLPACRSRPATIELDNSNSGGVDKVGMASVAGSTAEYWQPQLQDGAAPIPPSVSDQPFEVGFDPDVVAQPGITLVGPASGPLAGGTRIVIAGHDLIGATSVNFGGRPGALFPVACDTQITAVAPAGAAPGPVDVTVTTQGGTSPTSAGDLFTYMPNCVVPKLKRKTPSRARETIAAAHCSLGIVATPQHAKGHRLVVKAQSPAPGAVLADGAGVSVKLWVKPKRHHH